MQGVFISYRRRDSQSAAGRLADHLKEHIPTVPLFRDVETIEPGVDFVKAINRALQSCGVLLAVIGPRWVSLTDSNGRRRLDDPNDYTRLEIVTALQRSDVLVIPVLVEGAEMPTAPDLPEDLWPLCRRNALELTDKRWVYDVTQLEETVRKALKVGPALKPQPGSLPWYRRLTPKQWGYTAAGIVVLAALGEYGNEYSESDPAADYGAPAAEAAVDQNVGIKQDSGINNTATLTGYWRDLGGGQYSVVQQGQQVAIQGSSPYGPIYGTGLITNNVLNLTYTVNGVPYAAALTMNTNGELVGRYASSVAGVSGDTAMQRVR